MAHHISPIESISRKEDATTKLRQAQFDALYNNYGVADISHANRSAQVGAVRDTSVPTSTDIYTPTSKDSAAASVFNPEIRAFIESLMSNAEDMLQKLFLQLMSCSDATTSKLVDTTNVISQLKVVSNDLSSISQGMQAYYNFLTKATNVYGSGSLITAWNLPFITTSSGLSNVNVFKQTFLDAAGNQYNLSALKTALINVGGASEADLTSSNSTTATTAIKNAFIKMASVMGGQLEQVNANTNNTPYTTDMAYILGASGTGTGTDSIAGSFGNASSNSSLASDLMSLAGDTFTAGNSAAGVNTTVNAQLNALQAIYQQIYTVSTNTIKMAQDISNSLISKIG
jgi:hypothetical protein